jgi:REP element-mobilizing transposase RayT
VAVQMLGNWKKEENLLFEDDTDRERFLSRLAERVEQYNIRLYLYCLLTNHVHLVFETPEGNCSKFMQSLSTAYRFTSICATVAMAT